MRDEVIVIWNGRAGSAERADEFRAQLQRFPNYTVCETESAEAARQLAQEAVRRGAAQIVAAGGDGTVNAVINGMSDRWDSSTLAILPVGTGNDLCRTLAIPLDPQDAVPLLAAGEVRRIDLVEVETNGHRTFYANAATGGNSDRVKDCLTDELKRRWGPLCYLRGGIGLLADLTGYETTISFDDEPPQHFTAWNLVLANGRTSAGGLELAPRANPEDGLLDVVVVLDGTAVDIAVLAAQFALADYLESDQVVFRQARRVSVQSEPPIRFSADGELIETQPVTFTIRPQALRVVVGPDYCPEPLVARSTDNRR